MSLGAFVNVQSRDPAEWAAALNRMRVFEGLGHVEVWLETVPRTRRELTPMVETFAGWRTILHGPFVGLSLVHPLPQVRQVAVDHLAEACAVGAALGSEVMTVHCGAAPSFEDRRVLLERLAVSLSILRSRCEGGPVIAVENMRRRDGATRESLVTVDDCRELLELDPDTRFTLDIGHAVQNADKWDHFLAEHAEVIADLHLHGAVEDGRGHLSMVDEHSDITAADFAAAHHTSGYGGFVSVETLGWPDTEASFVAVRDALTEVPGVPSTPHDGPALPSR